MRPLGSLSCLFALVFALATSVAAQQPAEPTVLPSLDNVTRVESWSFFEPPPTGGDHDYTLLGNRARLGVNVDARRIGVEGSFQYAQLIGLPRDAIGPGPLGPGALYFAAARTPEAYQLYFKSMSLRLKNVLPDLSVQLGRMVYESSEETPFAGRLIGSAEWTPFERSFDGLRADYRRPTWRGHVSFFMPTQGAFEESASPTIGKLQLANARWATRAFEVFAHNYRDRRAVSARPDNTGIRVDAIDINIQTLGGGAAFKGIQLWGALQRGHWYRDPHRAFSYSVDGGHEWVDTRGRPSVRGGVAYASGDGDPNDKGHGTFFPMIPTTAPHLLRGTYAQMNLRDIYVTAAMHPAARLRLAAEVHHLSLANRQDRWYSGTGATAFEGDYFGFSSRSSTLRNGLGTYAQLSASRVMTQGWTMSASAGLMRGGDVVRRQFAGSTLFVMAIESFVSLP